MRRLLAASLLLALPACSVDPSPDPNDLAARLDCNAVDPDGSEEVLCTTDEGFLGITVFDDNDSRDVFVDISLGYNNSVLVGDRFVVEAASPDRLEQAQSALGGELIDPRD
jgi:hypothetical protein